MGNNNVKPSNTQIINNTDNKIDELVDIITIKSNEMIDYYKENFLNKDFCNKIELAYRDKLGDLDVEQLRKINAKIEGSNNKKLEVFIKYKSNDNERFIINELQGALIDYFFDKNIELNDNNILLGKYINSHIEKKIKQSGGGSNNDMSIENELNAIFKHKNNQKLNKKNGKKKENNNAKNNNLNNDIDEISNEARKNINSLDKIGNELVKELALPKSTQKDRIIANVKKLEQNNKNIKMLKNKFQKTFQINEKEKGNEKDNTEQNIKRKQKNNRRNHQKNWIEELYKVNFPKCEKGVCELTKKDLCKAIARNYLVRANIIMAILSTLPHKDSLGRYSRGFCHERLRALENSHVCLPKNYKDLKNLDDNKKIEEISRYINQTDEFNCHKIGGIYKLMNSKETKKLSDNNEFNQLYYKFSTKLRENYTNSLNSLLSILEELQKQQSIKTQLLNDIGKRVKEIIDNMYKDCQYNYLYAVLAFLNTAS